MNAEEMKNYKGVFVFAQQVDNKLSGISFELIGEGKYADALALLQTVRYDSRAQNALGVALYMTGAKTEAIDCFRRAAKNGNREAQDNLKQWEKIQEIMGTTAE